MKQEIINILKIKNKASIELKNCNEIEDLKVLDNILQTNSSEIIGKLKSKNNRTILKLFKYFYINNSTEIKTILIPILETFKRVNYLSEIILLLVSDLALYSNFHRNSVNELNQSVRKSKTNSDKKTIVPLKLEKNAFSDIKNIDSPDVKSMKDIRKTRSLVNERPLLNNLKFFANYLELHKLKYYIKNLCVNLLDIYSKSNFFIEVNFDDKINNKKIDIDEKS